MAGEDSGVETLVIPGLLLVGGPELLGVVREIGDDDVDGMGRQRG
jgi:hypothetical protein